MFAFNEQCHSVLKWLWAECPESYNIFVEPA